MSKSGLTSPTGTKGSCGIEVPNHTADSQPTKPGASWKADEEQVLPHNNMILVFTSLMLTLFLVSVSPAFASWSIQKLVNTPHSSPPWIKLCSVFPRHIDS